MQILAVLEIGHRLPPPMQCPQLAYELMNQCWAGEGNKRPQFAAIVEILEALMKKPLDMAHEYNAFDNTSWLAIKTSYNFCYIIKTKTFEAFVAK